MALAAFADFQAPETTIRFKVETVAQAGTGVGDAGSINSIAWAPSVNIHGDVAFVAQFAEGSAVVGVPAGEEPRVISFDPSNRIWSYSQISDNKQVVARDIFPGSPPTYYVRTWHVETGAMQIVAKSGGFYSSFVTPTINESGGMFYVGLIGSNRQLLYNPSGARDAHLSQGSLSGGGFRPFASGGQCVINTDVNGGDAIELRGVNNVRVADNSQWQALGSQASVAGSGIVAFYGERAGKSGIYISLNTARGREVFPVAELGETFSAFDAMSKRVGLAQTDDGSLLVVFAGTGTAGQGVYLARVDFDAAQSPVVSLVKDVHTGASSYSLYSPVSRKGHVCFEADDAIVLASPGKDLGIDFLGIDIEGEDGNSEIGDVSQLLPGSTFTLTTIVTNETLEALAGRYTVRYVMHDGNTLESSNHIMELGTEEKDFDLIAGGKSFLSRTITLANDLKGSFILAAILTAKDTENSPIADVNDANDRALSERLAIGVPDFVVDSISIEFDDFRSGEQGTLAINVRNIGDVDFVGRLEIEAGLLAEGEPDRILFVASRSLDVPSQGTDQFRYDFEMPLGLLNCRDYALVIKLDPNLDLKEALEDNNDYSEAVSDVAGPAEAIEIEILDYRTQGSGKDTLVFVDYRYRDPYQRQLSLVFEPSSPNPEPVEVIQLDGNLDHQAFESWASNTIRWKAGEDWPAQYTEKLKLTLRDECSGTIGDREPETLDTRPLFSIRDVTSAFTGRDRKEKVFLHGVRWYVSFETQVDWNGRTPDRVVFTTSSGNEQSVPVSDPDEPAVIRLNMGTDFGPHGRMEAIAIDSDGNESDPVDANLVVAPSPVTIPDFPQSELIIGLLAKKLILNGAGKLVDFEYDIGSSHVNSVVVDQETVPDGLPFFGKNAFGVKYAPKLGFKVKSSGIATLATPNGLTADKFSSKSEIQLKGGGVTLEGSVGMAVDWRYVGAPGDWDFDGGELTAKIGGGLGIGPRYHLIPITVPPFAIPVYLKADIKSNYTGKLDLSGVATGGVEEWALVGVVTPKIEGSITAGVGIHVVAAGEVYLKIAASQDYKYDGTLTRQEQKIVLSGGFNLILLTRKFSKPVFEMKWPDPTARGLGDVNIDSLIESEIPRGYLRAGLRSSIPLSPGEGFLVERAYPYSSVSIAHRLDTVDLVFLQDVEDRLPNNRTGVAFAEFADGSWSVPTIIEDDGTPDSAPTIVPTDAGFVAAWGDLSEPVSEASTLEDMVSLQEISVAHFNAETGHWSEAVQLTNNDVLDHSPVLATGDGLHIVLWQQNPNNEFLAAGSTLHASIFQTDWSAPIQVAQISGTTMGLDTEFRGDALHALIAIDADADFNTDNDVELYRLTRTTNGTWSALHRLTNNDVPDRNPQMLKLTDGRVVTFWYSGGRILFSEAADLSNPVEVMPRQESILSEQFQVAEGPDGRIALTWASASDTGQDLYTSVFDAEKAVWSRALRLTHDDLMERDVATVFTPDGDLLSVYNKVPIDLVPRTTELNGEDVELEIPTPNLNQVALVSMQRTLGQDLAVIGVELDPLVPAPGDSVIARVEVGGVGELSATGTVRILAGETELASLPVPRQVPGGGEMVVPLEFTMPDSNELLAEITMTDGTDRDPSNDQFSFVALQPELGFRYIELLNTGAGRYLLSAVIENLGGAASGDFNLEIRVGTADGELLSSQTLSLAGAAATEMEIELVDVSNGPEFAVFATLDAGEAVDEIDEDNNSALVNNGNTPAAMPLIEPGSGTFDAPQEVVMSSPQDGVTIRYTTDGSMPTEASDAYTAPFTVSAHACIRAIAFHPNLPPSRVGNSTLWFAGENRPPRVNDLAISAIDNDFLSLQLAVTASDPDTPPEQLTYSWSADDAIAFSDSTASSLTLTFPELGTFEVRLQLSDGETTVERTYSLRVPIDDDTDRLPDVWELQFFGHQDFNAFDDPDNDTLDNLAEFEGGSNPDLVAPATPFALAPVANEPTGLAPTLSATVFSGDPRASFSGSQWQVATDAAFATLVWDSGFAPPAGQIGVAADALAANTSYLWRVRYAESADGLSEWSAWSQAAAFTTVNALPFSDDFAEDRTWQYSEGWERGAASAGTSNDPATDASDGDDNQLAGFVIGGDYPSEQPAAAYLVSPAVDCSQSDVVELAFKRWLAIDNDEWARASIEVSNDDGATWTQIWRNRSTPIDDGDWLPVQYDISHLAARHELVRVRFTMGPFHGALPAGGWSIDDVEIRAGQTGLAAVWLESEQTEFTVGDTIQLRVLVQDNHPDAGGFRGGPVDLRFDDARLDYNGSFNSSGIVQPPFNAIQTSGSLQAGLINELGGVTPISGLADGFPAAYAILAFVAQAPGEALFQLEPGESGFSLTPPVGIVVPGRIDYGSLAVTIVPQPTLPDVQVWLTGPNRQVSLGEPFDIVIKVQENTSADGFLGGPVDVHFDPEFLQVESFEVLVPFEEFFVSGEVDGPRINELGGATRYAGHGDGTPADYARVRLRSIAEGDTSVHVTAGEIGLALRTPIGIVPPSQIDYGAQFPISIGEGPPHIIGGAMGAANAYVDVEFSEPVMKADDSDLDAASFRLEFAANGGEASGASISSATAISDTVYRLQLTLTGIPTGVETLAVLPADGASIYDTKDTPAATSESTPSLPLFDQAAPRIDAVVAISADGLYALGNLISLRIDLNEPVLVTGTPRLHLDTGNVGESYAEYVSGSGGQSLFFSYSVADGDETNLLRLADGPELDVSQGEVADRAGNLVNGTLPTPGADGSLSAVSTIRLDGKRPVIESVKLEGANERLRIRFSEGVYVGGAGVSLEALGVVYDGSDDAEGMSVAALTDTGGHPLIGGENELLLNIKIFGVPNGSEIVTLNPVGLIADAGSNALGDTQPIEIAMLDARPPAVTSLSTPLPDGIYGTGVAIPIDIQFSKPVLVDGHPRLALETGLRGSSARYDSGSGTEILRFVYTVEAGAGIDLVTASSSDALSVSNARIYDIFGNEGILALPAPGAPDSLSATHSIALDTLEAVIIDAWMTGTDSLVVRFSRSIFHQDNQPAELADFELSLLAGAATAGPLVLESVSRLDGSPLVGGETAFAFGFDLQGEVDGSEVLELGVSAESQLVDEIGNAVATSVSSGPLAMLAGSLIVSIEPAEAVADGATWRIRLPNGLSKAYASGERVNNLPVGDHELVFANISGWDAVPSRVVSIAPVELREESATYVERVVPPSHFVLPEGSDAGLTWTVFLLSATLDGEPLAVDDEIAIFDRERLVGHVQLAWPLSGRFDSQSQLTVFADFANGDPGFTVGQPYRVVAWDAAGQQKIENVTIRFPFGGYDQDVFPSSPSVSVMHLEFSSFSEPGLIIRQAPEIEVTWTDERFWLNGNADLQLVRGETYEFRLNTPGHRFYLTTQADSGTPYSDGVGGVGNLADTGSLYFSPTEQTPDLLFYASGDETEAGGMLTIVDSVEELQLSSSEAGGYSDLLLRLQQPPAANVQVEVLASAREFTLSDEILIFNPVTWKDWQRLRVTGRDDQTLDGDTTEALTLRLSNSDDVTYASLVDQTLAIVNIDSGATLPELQIVSVDGQAVPGTAMASISDRAEVSEGDTTEFQVGIAAGQLPYSYRWYVAGVQQGENAESLSWTIDHDVVGHPNGVRELIVRCEIEDATGAIVQAEWNPFTVVDVDRLPPVAEIAFSLATPKTGDDIEIQVLQQGADPDGDTIVGHAIEWLLVGTAAARNAITGTLLQASNTRRGDRWQVQVAPITAPYGNQLSAPETVAEIAIANTPPAIPAQAALPVLAGTNITVRPQVDDPDFEELADQLNFEILDDLQEITVVSFNADTGEVEVSVPAGTVAMESLELRVTDAEGESDTATIQLNIAGWSLPIGISGAQPDRLEIGMHPNAELVFDPGLDALLPPVGSPRVALIREALSFQRDVQAEADEATWLLQAEATGSDPVILSWDIGTLPGIALTLREVDETGTPVPNGLRATLNTVNRIEIAAGSTQRFEIVAGLLEFTLTLPSGWSVASLPIIVEKGEITRLRNRGITSIRGWNGEMGPSGSLEEVDTMLVGKGYYLFNSGDEIAPTLRGQAPTDYDAQLAYGWNLIGIVRPAPYTETLPAVLFADFANMKTSRFWWWNGTTFRAATVLRPGKAYWVYRVPPEAP